MEFSNSRLEKYLNCPASYRFEYVDALEWEFQPVNLVFGKVIHAVLQEYHRSLLSGTDFDCAMKFERLWKATVLVTPTLRLNSLDALELLRRGKILCQNYQGQIRYSQIQDVELYFELPLIDAQTGRYDGHVIHGRIDLVADDGVLEFKTSSRSVTQEEVSESEQLTLYAWAYELLYGRKPKRICQINLIKTLSPKIEVIETIREPKDFTRLHRVMSQAMKAIEREVFFPNPQNKWGCGNCVFQQHCQKMY